MGVMNNPKKVIPQLLVAFAAALGYMNTGLIRGWSSPGIPSIKEERPFNATEDQYSWISSTPALSALFGSLASGVPMHMIGRRATMLMIVLPMSAAWLIVGFAVDAGMVIAGRTVAGVMSGIMMPASQLFIGECASPRIRGVLGSCTALALAMGVLIAYIFGSFMPWDDLSFFIAAFPILFGVAVFFCPESPVWLQSKGRDEEAKEALQRLRGSHTDVSQELDRIRENIDKSKNLPKLRITDYFKASAMKPLVLSMALMFFQQFSGINAITYYTVAIFESAGSTIDRHVATIIVGIVQLVCTGLSTTLVDKAGRRILLMVSAACMAASQSGLAAYFYLKEVNGSEWAETNIGWLPLLTLITYIMFYSAGFINIPYVIMGELFPVRYRSILGAVSNAFNLVCTFLVVKYFPEMQVGIGTYGAFWLFSGCCVVGFFFVLFFLPETKGKTLEQIERMFSGEKEESLQTGGVNTISDKVKVGEKEGAINDGYDENTL